MLQIYGQEDIDTLPAGKWGIREPGPEWQGRRRASGKALHNEFGT